MPGQRLRQSVFAGESRARFIGGRQTVIADALSILARRIKKVDVAASSPNAIKTYLICRFGRHEQEVFSIL
ncbi:hypothetical protein, partial [Herbaspirillum sp. RV1423]|uniref:hypothetical protein n=1 Tax=Herbaspirillum sp. RV1423 TaxID=1443993 RepID=UPI000554314E